MFVMDSLIALRAKTKSIARNQVVKTNLDVAVTVFAWIESSTVTVRIIEPALSSKYFDIESLTFFISEGILHCVDGSDEENCKQIPIP